MLEKIIESIREMSKWASKNGFSNRGRHPMSYYADELEKAQRIIALAYKTLEDCEHVYMKFYIEKVMELDPTLAKEQEKRWERVRNNWVSKEEIRSLYQCCVRHHPELEPLPELLTTLITYGKVK